MTTRRTHHSRRHARAAGHRGRRLALGVCGLAVALCGALVWLADSERSADGSAGPAAATGGAGSAARALLPGSADGAVVAARLESDLAVVGGRVVPLAAAAARVEEPLDEGLPAVPRAGTEAHYVAAFEAALAERGEATYIELTGAVLSGAYPDCARVAALRVAEEAGLECAADLLGLALVAPADAPRARLALADWAAQRLELRAARDPRATQVLARLVTGEIPCADAARRRRAATCLARHGERADVERLLLGVEVGQDPLLAASLAQGLTDRADAEDLAVLLPARTIDPRAAAPLLEDGAPPEPEREP